MPNVSEKAPGVRSTGDSPRSVQQLAPTDVGPDRHEVLCTGARDDLGRHVAFRIRMA
jgi:hypothetical protein